MASIFRTPDDSENAFVSECLVLSAKLRILKGRLRRLFNALADKRVLGSRTQIMRRRRLFLVFSALIALPLVGLLGFGAWLERWGHVDRATPASAIIIFGAKVRADGSASSLLRARTRHAFELWKRGLAPKIVCTGGVGDFAPAESVVQTRLLTGWGVPASAIVREEKSTSTRENALFASQLLPRGAKVIAVSDPFHLFRCRRDLARVGLSASTSPEVAGWDALPIQSRVFYCAREAALVLRDTLFGS